MPPKRKRDATETLSQPHAPLAQTSHLALLPQEILNQIAEHVMHHPEGIAVRCVIPSLNRPVVHRERVYFSRKRLLSLARVSRRMWKTCLPIFFASNAFIFSYRYQAAFKRFWSTIDEDLLGKITSLELCLPQAAFIQRAMLSFTNLRTLEVYLNDHDDEGFFHRPERQERGLVRTGTRSPHAVILEVLCHELVCLRRVVITVDYCAYFDVRENNSVRRLPLLGPQVNAEQLVDEMRGMLQERHPDAVVRLYERLVLRRMRKDAFDEEELLWVQTREYFKPGEYSEFGPDP